MLKARFGQSIFSILLSAFLLIVMPIYLGGFLVYSWGVSQVKSEISRSIAAQNSYVIETLDNELRGMRNHLSSLLSNRDIRLLAVSGNSMNEIERIFAIRQVQDHLRLLMVSSQYISNVSLHVPAINRSIHALGSITELQAEHYIELDRIAAGAVGQIDMTDGRPTLYQAYPQQYLNRTGVSTHMLEVRLSQEAIARNLSLMADSSFLALYSAASGSLLASSAADDAPARYFLESVDEQLSGFSGQIDYAGAAYLVTINRQASSELVLVGYTPQLRIYQPLLRYQPLFWSFTAFVAILAVLFFFLLYRLLHRPLRQFMTAFHHLEDGRFDIQLTHRHNDEFRKLYAGFNTMVNKVRHLVDQVYKQTIYAQQAELKQLQSQISPHFLYNSFFVLQNMADNGDVDDLSAYAGLMGRYFQYITRNREPDALLAEEVEHARIYATLQEKRFRNRISVKFAALPSDLERFPVPRLVLQPILENAFEHGLKNKLRDGQIHVSYSANEDEVAIVVADNGDEITPDAINSLTRTLSLRQDNLETTGLLNVHRRLQIRFGTGSGLLLEQTAGGGLTVRMILRIAKK
ncbi:MAG: histidine kinase [Bacillota bacterium]|nr:histidine kinase [Bacillota bacterium]